MSNISCYLITFFLGPELGFEPGLEVSQTSVLTILLVFILFTLLWPLTGIRSNSLPLRMNLILEPSNNFNLALNPIGIVTLPLESILKAALDLSLVN